MDRCASSKSFTYPASPTEHVEYVLITGVPNKATTPNPDFRTDETVAMIEMAVGLSEQACPADAAAETLAVPETVEAARLLAAFKVAALMLSVTLIAEAKTLTPFPTCTGTETAEVRLTAVAVTRQPYFLIAAPKAEVLLTAVAVTRQPYCLVIAPKATVLLTAVAVTLPPYRIVTEEIEEVRLTAVAATCSPKPILLGGETTATLLVSREILIGSFPLKMLV
jgi:hypothetical protein